MMMVMECFHHRVDRIIVGMIPRHVNDGEREWPPVDTALEVTGLWNTRECVIMWQATIVDYIAAHPIFEICTQDGRREGYIRTRIMVGLKRG